MGSSNRYVGQIKHTTRRGINECSVYGTCHIKDNYVAVYNYIMSNYLSWAIVSGLLQSNNFFSGETSVNSAIILPKWIRKSKFVLVRNISSYTAHLTSFNLTETRWALANPCPSMIEPVVQSLQKGRPFVVRGLNMYYAFRECQSSCTFMTTYNSSCRSVVGGP